MTQAFDLRHVERIAVDRAFMTDAKQFLPHEDEMPKLAAVAARVRLGDARNGDALSDKALKHR